MGKYTGGGNVTVQGKRGRGMIHGNSFLCHSFNVGVFRLENSFVLKWRQQVPAKRSSVSTQGHIAKDFLKILFF